MCIRFRLGGIRRFFVCNTRADELNAVSELKRLFPENKELHVVLDQGNIQTAAFILGQECKWDDPESSIIDSLDHESAEDVLKGASMLISRAKRIMRIKELLNKLCDK